MKRVLWLFLLSTLLASVVGYAQEAGPMLSSASSAEPAPEMPVPPMPRPPAEPDFQGIPMGLGLPVMVRVAVYFVDIEGIDESEGTFTATVDVRLRWRDPRLVFPKESIGRGFKDMRGEETEAWRGQAWTPDIHIANQRDEPTFTAAGVRIFPNGQVEMMQRTSGKFAMTFDVERFPFDRQQLQIELVSRRDTAEEVSLDYRQDDLDFSRVSPNTSVDGWAPGLVNLRREGLAGWHGQSHARVFVSLEVARQPGNSLAPIFIPLFASLLIPLLSIWLNRVEDAELQIEAFELTNIIIGGLFAVIALNFTVNSEYPLLGSGDNTVTRLFALNYLTLATALLINVTLFRFKLIQRRFGKFVQEQLFLYLIWAVPILVFGTAVAMLVAARV